MRTVFLVSLFSLAGCTDTQVARLGSYGNAADITCYSGGVHSPENSDGWAFKDAETGKLMEVSGDCILSVQE